LEGIVKRWLDHGYGFIGVEDSDDDLFVHHTGINGASELRAGQKVEFDMESTPRGLRAVNVKIVE
jgi:CspA family cold shock protein